MIEKIGTILKRILVFFIAVILLLLVYYLLATRISEPEIDHSLIKLDELKIHNDTNYSYQDSWLRKNRFGLWEMYISGSPTELGIKNGILSQRLIEKQEEAFVAQVKRMVPSNSHLNFLKYIASYMNRKLPDYIPEDYLTEIKAVSLFASDKFDFIGNNYKRQLNYHAAHDIGHAMQNLHLVECTAFAAWNTRTVDSSLLIGRNFDFYVGDEFAENKILLFVKPNKGYPFASITWGGMIGVVSGMNNQGLSITLNSAKGDIPFIAKTPVSIIAREILQYAGNISDAYEIAKSRPSFVAESFMIASASDEQVAIIEKTPDTTILFFSNTDHIVLTNHFQSQALKSSDINMENMQENVTTYRFSRVEELLNKQDKFDEQDFSNILRDTKGINDADIGLSNEGAVNQLIAHHSIIFKPEQNLFWISTTPFQLGTYLAYNLDSVFYNSNSAFIPHDLADKNISADSIFLTTSFLQFQEYKNFLNIVSNGSDFDISKFIKTNSQYFYTYEIIGDYYLQLNDIKNAKKYYTKALTCFIPNLYEEKRIKEKMNL